MKSDKILNTSDNTKKRNTYFDFVKYITIFCVLWGHVVQQTYKYGRQPIPIGPMTDDIFRLIYTFHMPLFMGICGFFLAKSLMNNKDYFHDKLAKRLLGLLIPMLSFGLLKLIAAPNVEWNLLSYIKSVHGIWFLGDLAINTVLISFISKKLSDNLSRDIKWFCLGIPFSMIPTIGYGGTGLFMYPFFCAGFITNYYFKGFVKCKYKEYHFICLSMFIFILSYYVYSHFLPCGGNFTINFRKFSITEIAFADICKVLLGFLGCYIVLNFIKDVHNFIRDSKLCSIMVHRGQFTLEIYLLNIVILEILGGKRLYPWLMEKSDVNWLHANGFMFEIISTFMVTCIVMEIIILIIKCIQKYPILSKLFFWK